MSTAIETERLYTPEDLLSMRDGDDFELVDGRLREPNPSVLSSWVGSQLLGTISRHVDAHKLGWVFSPSLRYRCFAHRPDVVYKPDASFIAAERFTLDDLRTQHIVTIAPDLVVEVVAPGDDAGDLEIKTRDYLKAGVRLVWIVFPVARTTRVHRPDGSMFGFDDAGAFDGEDVLPGFRCAMNEILLPPSMSP